MGALGRCITAAALLGAAACGGASTPAETPVDAETPAPVVEIAAPAKVAGPSEEGEDTTTGWQPYPPGRPTKPGKLDVPECNAYFDTITQCLAAMGEKTGGLVTAEIMVEQIREQFRQIAYTPEGRQQLAATCKAAQDAMTSVPVCR
jgi:hypothetical protein